MRSMKLITLSGKELVGIYGISMQQQSILLSNSFNISHINLFIPISPTWLGVIETKITNAWRYVINSLNFYLRKLLICYPIAVRPK